MTNLLRSFLRAIFILEAVPMGAIAAIVAVGSWQAASGGRFPQLREDLYSLIEFGGAFVVLAVAIWQTARGTRWARGWGVAAGVVNIGGVLTSLPLRSRTDQLFGLGMLVVGVTAIFAFLNRHEFEQVAGIVAEGPRLRGDGTNRFLNKLIGPIAFLGPAVGIVWWVPWTFRNGIPITMGLPFLAEIMVIGIIVTVIHELGHVVFGLGLGMKLQAFLVGPLEWHFRHGKWQFKMNLKGMFSAAGAAGLVPTKSTPDRMQYVLMIAGGPVANLVTALFFFGMALPNGGEHPGEAHGVWALLGVFSLFAFLTNLVPLRTRSYYSDGAQLFQLLAGGPWADLHQVMHLAAASAVTPLRPRDLHFPSIERAAEGIAEGRTVMLLWLYAYEHFLDLGLRDEAAEALYKAESVYPQVSGDVPTGLLGIFAFANAYLHRDANTARIWWDRVESKKPTKFNSTYWLANSALHWVEGSLEAANESWQKGNDLAQKLPKAGAYEFDRHCFALLRQAMDEVPVAV